MAKLLWIALFVAPLACGGNSSSPTPDAGSPDAAPDAPSGPPPNTVLGRLFQICPQPTGTVTLGADLSQSTVQALIPDPTAATGFRTQPGTARADGTFEIDGVPDHTTYLLQIDNAFYVTDQHAIEISSLALGRCTPAPALPVGATPVTLDLTAMAAFDNRTTDGDLLEVTSTAAGSLVMVPNAQTGATAVHTTVDWTKSPIPTLPDAALGDDFIVQHLRRGTTFATAPRIQRSSTLLVDAFETNRVTVRAGAATTVSGAFSAGPAVAPLSVRLDRPQLAGPYQDHNELLEISLQLSAGPYAIGPFGANVLGSVELFGAHLADAAGTETLAYHDPYPASWNRAVVIDSEFSRWYLGADEPAGTTSFRGAPTGIVQVVPFAAGFTPPPVMPPPSALRVNGTDVTESGAIAFDGKAPVTLTWQASAAATSYRIQIAHLTGDGNFDLITLVRTAATSVTLPAALFTDNEFYVFGLAAIENSDGFTTGHLEPPIAPSQTAQIASGRWRFSSTCGNGHIELGEACDGGGETAGCNADCTRAGCGDGVVNHAAGETCDTLHDTASCNAATCTAPTCGDGHIDFQIEDCDDGNTVDDGNGCSAQCTHNNVCGNHVVEDLVEFCDDGGVDTARCNADCTLPRCGDGHVNAAAGEECDDGNQDDTDHCSNACKRQ